MKDGSVMFSPLENMEKIYADLNNTALAFVKIEGRITNRFSVDYIDEYVPMDDIDLYIATLNRQEREAVQAREKTKKEAVWRWFESKQEAVNWLEKRREKREAFLNKVKVKK